MARPEVSTDTGVRIADIVRPVTFFVSPAASFVTGQVLYVDGGITESQ